MGNRSPRVWRWPVIRRRALVEQIQNSHRHGHVLVYGPRGVGKTTLIAQFIRSEQLAYSLDIDLGSVDGTTGRLVHDVANSLSKQLSKTWPGFWGRNRSNVLDILNSERQSDIQRSNQHSVDSEKPIEIGKIPGRLATKTHDASEEAFLFSCMETIGRLKDQPQIVETMSDTISRFTRFAYKLLQLTKKPPILVVYHTKNFSFLDNDNLLTFIHELNIPNIIIETDDSRTAALFHNYGSDGDSERAHPSSKNWQGLSSVKLVPVREMDKEVMRAIFVPWILSDREFAKQSGRADGQMYTDDSGHFDLVYRLIGGNLDAARKVCEYLHKGSYRNLEKSELNLFASKPPGKSPGKNPSLETALVISPNKDVTKFQRNDSSQSPRTRDQPSGDTDDILLDASYGKLQKVLVFRDDTLRYFHERFSDILEDQTILIDRSIDEMMMGHQITKLREVVSNRNASIRSLGAIGSTHLLFNSESVSPEDKVDTSLELRVIVLESIRAIIKRHRSGGVIVSENTEIDHPVISAMLSANLLVWYHEPTPHLLIDSTFTSNVLEIWCDTEFSKLSLLDKAFYNIILVANRREIVREVRNA